MSDFLRRRIEPAIIVAAMLAALPAGAARAAQIQWPTYLHVGPGQQYAVIDELSRDAPVQVQACSGGWCRVLDGDTVGYVEADTIANAPQVAAPAAAPGAASCLVVEQAGYPKGQVARFCPAAPAAQTVTPAK